MIAEAEVQSQSGPGLHIVLHKKIGHSIALAGNRRRPCDHEQRDIRSQGEKARIRRVTQTQVFFDFLKILSLVVPVADDLRAKLKLVAALHPSQRVQIGEIRVVHNQVEQHPSNLRYHTKRIPDQGEAS